jgi:hypothetical protein
MGNTDVAVLVGLGALFLVLVRVIWRSNRRSRRTDVGPVSEQWLAERRGKED